MPGPSADQINRLYAAIDQRYPEEVHGGDVLEDIREFLGRHDFRYYDELTAEEIEEAIEKLGG